jgi:integrase
MRKKEIINNYINHIEIYKRKNLSSLYKETRMVLKLNECLEAYNIEDIQSFDSELFYHVIRWYRNYTKSKNSTINKNLKLLERIFKFNDLDITHKLKKLPDDTLPFEPIQESKLKKILNYLNNLDIEYKNNQAYQLAFYMLLDTGCRASELLEIKTKNINLSNNTILLEYTKNGSKDYVFFTKFSHNKIKQLIDRNLGISTEYLFYNFDKKRKMNVDDLNFFVRKIKEDLKLNKLHLHQFRKTLATTLHDNGVDIFDIKEILRHKTLEMTNIYVRSSVKRIKNKYDEAATWYEKEKK